MNIELHSKRLETMNTSKSNWAWLKIKCTCIQEGYKWKSSGVILESVSSDWWLLLLILQTIPMPHAEITKAVIYKHVEWFVSQQ